MNHDLFDNLARSLLAVPTRRGVMRHAIGTAIGGVAGRFALAEADASKRKKKRRRRKRSNAQRRREQDQNQNSNPDQNHDQNQGQCVPLTTVFEPSAGTCTSSEECCANGTCCTFEDVVPVSGCYDLLTHTTACGLSCETVVNCLNTDQICVNGQCFDA